MSECMQDRERGKGIERDGRGKGIERDGRMMGGGMIVCE